jgi:hypothetical protein
VSMIWIQLIPLKGPSLQKQIPTLCFVVTVSTSHVCSLVKFFGTLWQLNMLFMMLVLLKPTCADGDLFDEKMKIRVPELVVLSFGVTTFGVWNSSDQGNTRHATIPLAQLHDQAGSPVSFAVSVNFVACWWCNSPLSVECIICLSILLPADDVLPRLEHCKLVRQWSQLVSQCTDVIFRTRSLCLSIPLIYGFLMLNPSFCYDQFLYVVVVIMCVLLLGHTVLNYVGVSHAQQAHSWCSTEYPRLAFASCSNRGCSLLRSSLHKLLICTCFFA